uniref:Reverse transcriptase domain-containing protein n=1 Tax=Tanacetum cinerariifolium TaxID=118510 RepID=A0A6L2MDG1_TANCI|nr:reverse transcriptase domain-containing protein [Tanacetum cinerariifolium]
MSTRSSSSDLFPPSSDLESIIRNRQRKFGDPSLLLDIEEINMNPNNNPRLPPAGPNPQNYGPPGLTPQNYGPPGPNLQNPSLNLRTMEELLQAPTDDVGDAILVPPFLLVNLNGRSGCLILISFHSFENDDPHSHIQRSGPDLA